MSEVVETQKTNVFLVVLALLPFVVFIYKHFKASISQSLPPGPSPLPLIGNLHQLGKNLHISFTDLAKIYGPLISVKLGTQQFIIGASPAAASEILKNSDRILSGRRPPECLAIKNIETENHSFGWQPECNEKWKYLRTICRTEMFSSKAIESQACLREKKAMEMVRMIRGMEGRALNIGEIVFATVFNTLSNVFLSQDLIGLSGEDDGKEESMKGLVRRLVALASTPNLSDLYPVFAGLDLQSIKRKSTILTNKICATWESTMKERRDRKGIDGSRGRDFLDALIEDGFTNDQINFLIFELLSAGTDSTASTVEWVMAALTRYPKCMKRVQEEIAREIEQDELKESQIPRLQYLQACIKEVLRLYPPGPLLLPHRATETCQVMNYTIPKDSRLMVNVWAIGRDPAVWEDPLVFKPERFLDSEVDYKGNDFEFLPFGTGRRICPGLPMAAKEMPLLVASLIRFFDWSLPMGNDPEKLDMSEKFGIILGRKEPLFLIPKAKFSGN